MKLLKKNQVIIYVIAIMIMAAGYLNFTTNNNKQTVETSMKIEASDDTLLADIGDATLVSSNDIATNTHDEKNNDISNTETLTMDNDDITEETNAKAIEDDYFAISKLERNNMYSQMLETYDKILNSTNSLEIQKQSATQEITKINELKNSIMICENLLTTKGFDKNVVFINGDSINVIIGGENLETEQVAQIQYIITRELKAEIDNIHISIKQEK